MKLAGMLIFLLRESAGSRGRLVFFTACVSIGVAAVVAVAGLAGAMGEGMRAQSRQLMAADFKLQSHQPMPLDPADVLGDRAPGARSTQVRELATMAGRVGEDDEVQESRLVELKVVDGTYPFYGVLGIEARPEHRGAAVLDELLTPTTVVVAPELGQGLGLGLGDPLRLGGVDFEITAWLHDEPDRMGFSLTLGPRVFLSQEGLERTSLLGVGNRVRYSTLVAVPGNLKRKPLTELAEQGRDFVQGQLVNESDRVRVSTHYEAQPNVRRGLDRFTQFLGLVALLSLVLGGIGVAQIVRSWLGSKTVGIAVWRVLGLRPREILFLHLLHALIFALIGSLLGAFLGGMVPFLLPRLAPELVPADLIRPWQPLALLRGIGLGVGVAAIFALPALVAVWRVSPNLVLRSEAEPLQAPRAVRAWAFGLLFLGLFLSAWIQAERIDYAGGFTLGLGLLALALLGGARLLMLLSSRVPRGRLGPLVTYGLAALARPGAGTVGSIVALGLGSLVVLTMALVEHGLSSELRGALPENAPSVFLVDVQRDQWEGVRGLLEDEAAERIEMVPVIMARYAGSRVEGEAGEPRSKAEWATSREQRLTYLEELPASNHLVAGELWQDPEHFEISMEVDYAESLGVELGDLVSFRIQGVPIELKLTSLREVSWESFEINFFLVVEPGVLEQVPQFRLAAALLEPAAEDRVQNALVDAYPNITFLRVRPIIERVALLMERIALGVRFLGSFTILAGIVILAGSVGASQARRGREVAILKTLGVSRAGVRRMFITEFALAGLVAGLLGVLGAFGLAWCFLELVLKFDSAMPWWALGVGVLGTALLATLAGLAASARALREPPVQSLRG